MFKKCYTLNVTNGPYPLCEISLGQKQMGKSLLTTIFPLLCYIVRLCLRVPLVSVTKVIYLWMTSKSWTEPARGQPVLDRVILNRAQSVVTNRIWTTTLTGRGVKDLQDLWALDPPMTTHTPPPWVRRALLSFDHFTKSIFQRSIIFIVKLMMWTWYNHQFGFWLPSMKSREGKTMVILFHRRHQHFTLKFCV